MNALEIVEPEDEGKQDRVSRDDLRKVVQMWKMIKGIPTEGERGKAWDRANWGRVSKSCKTLLLTFGDWRKAAGCIEYVYTKLTEDGMSCTLETVVKRSDDYWEVLAKGDK